MTIRFKKLKDTALTPVKMHPEDACYDLYAPENTHISAHGIVTIMLGIAVEIPYGFAGIIKGRSGLTKVGIIVPTGTVDANYRGEVGVTLLNVSSRDRNIKQGDRIAQFCVLPTFGLQFEEVSELTSTGRGTNGFGSTGGVSSLTEAEK